MPKTKTQKLQIALVIIQTVLLVLATVAVGFAIAFAVSFLSIEDAAQDSTVSEQLGVGLSRAFSAVFFVIAAACTTLLAIPGEIVSVLTTVKTKGWRKTLGICGIVAHAVFVVACGVLLVFIV